MHVIYSQAIAYLYGLQRFGVKLGLESIARLLQAVGDPHRRVPSILIGGTNGKGSTAAFLASILQAAGYRIGLYTSPHLLDFTERIRVDGQGISSIEVARLTDELRSLVTALFPEPQTPHLGPRTSDPAPRTSHLAPCTSHPAPRTSSHPTFFEVTTALAFLHFARTKVDFAVIEVGLGGRFDATNILDPEVAVITNIALEHQEYLGRTLGAIAAEKAGIVREGSHVVTAADSPEALAVIAGACRAQGATLLDLRAACNWQISRSDLSEQRFTLAQTGEPTGEFTIRLLGRHQVTNAATAIAAARLLRARGAHIPEGSIREGLRGARWPGRLQLFPGHPLVILDAAHNPAGAKALRGFLEEQRFAGRLILVFGVLQDKDWIAMLQELGPLARRVILTRPESDRAADPRGLVEAERFCAKLEILEDVPEAITLARAVSERDDAVVVTGSLFIISAALRALGVREATL
ncbi:MAG: bifunctional folylpolyglutamate synthase/dihydrofolate synthase [candidate division NC10 bacterium]|nr:bifunctional folylpolyglutamate synthase/dihydrofolate synthase [candidate division NC10 bacterium]